MTEQLETPKKFAERVNVTPRCVRKWCEAGKLRAVLIGRTWRIYPGELERLAALPTNQSADTDSGGAGTSSDEAK